MNAVSEFAKEFDEVPAGLGLTETYWGYILRERNPEFTRREISEWLMMVTGFVFLLVGLGQWFLPGALVNVDVVAIKMAITAVFVGMGCACIQASGARTEVEIQVDTALRELRVVERDRRGLTRLSQRIAMRDIDSVFLSKGGGVESETHLLLEVANSDHPVHVASGTERELRLLQKRMKNDLRPASERVERRLMRQAADAMTDRTGLRLSA